MALKKKTDTLELNKLEKLLKEFGNMEVMKMMGYVSVAPIYSWRKSKKIPTWAKSEINRIFKEKKIEGN